MIFSQGKLFLVGLLCWSSLAGAAESTLTAKNILDQMQAQEAKWTDLQFELKQVIELKGLKEKQTVRGKVIYKKPDSLYVEYSAPVEQMVIANKDDLVMYVREKGKWQESMRQKVSNLIGKQWKTDYGLWAVGDLEKNYEAKAVMEKGGMAILILEPKDKTYPFKLKIFIDTKNWLPVHTVWEDDNQLITSDLLKVKVNAGVKEEIFKFR